jgi:hypothetical protein
VIKLQQVVAYLKNNGVVQLEILNNRQQALIALAHAIRTQNTPNIGTYVRNALNEGATKQDILNLMAFILGDTSLLNTFIELLFTLQYEENRNTPPISILDDVKE